MVLLYLELRRVCVCARRNTITGTRAYGTLHTYSKQDRPTNKSNNQKIRIDMYIYTCIKYYVYQICCVPPYTYLPLLLPGISGEPSSLWFSVSVCSHIHDTS